METNIKIEVRRGAEILSENSFSDAKSILVGRSKDTDVVIPAQDVSRRHLIIKPTNNGFYVEDLSLNGVVCEGVKVKDDHVFAFGSLLTFGDFGLQINNAQPNGDAQKSESILRIQALKQLVDHVNLAALEKEEDMLRPRVEAALDRILYSEKIAEEDRKRLVTELSDEALGLGPLEKLLANDEITEVMVVDPVTIYVEKSGRLEQADCRFSSAESVRTVIERIITPLGRRIDESSPMVDARLKDGSRVNAIIPPLAIKGPNITIRKFFKKPLTIKDLINFGSLDKQLADFLKRAVEARLNIVISGGTGSGKTTLLNVMAGAISPKERIVTIEDAAELKLPQPHVVTLETRPANAEGKGQVSIRDLVKNSLRMRPDRIVVGECRGGEALDMLQAMNTGHDGSLTTTHANSPAEAVSRLETLCLMSGVDLPSRAIREQIASAVDLIVQQSRFADGKRRITSVAEVSGISEDGQLELNDIYVLRFPENGQGEPWFQATGRLPMFGKQPVMVGMDMD